MKKLNAKQLRLYQGKKPKIEKQDIYIILDNILDTYNIGAIFRLADAVAVKKIFICGLSETPPNHRIKKSSINTTEVVDWEYAESTLEAISNLKSQIPNIKIVAVEQSVNSIPYDKYNYSLPIALIVGHETDGISTQVLENVDAIVELPMYGINISLNVMVSLAIVLYEVLEKSLN